MAVGICFLTKNIIFLSILYVAALSNIDFIFEICDIITFKFEIACDSTSCYHVRNSLLSVFQLYYRRTFMILQIKICSKKIGIVLNRSKTISAGRLHFILQVH